MDDLDILFSSIGYDPVKTDYWAVGYCPMITAAKAHVVRVENRLAGILFFRGFLVRKSIILGEFQFYYFKFLKLKIYFEFEFRKFD